MAEAMIVVEVISAEASSLLCRRIVLEAGSTVAQAIEASGIADISATATPDVGIFGRKVLSNHVVQDGDRIEIYRPLLLDPMEARRKRARTADPRR
ncbi:MAG: RnfH family protein [Rhodanobacter sp.]